LEIFPFILASRFLSSSVSQIIESQVNLLEGSAFNGCARRTNTLSNRLMLAQSYHAQI
jgi:hypothetical protein